VRSFPPLLSLSQWVILHVNQKSFPRFTTSLFPLPFLPYLLPPLLIQLTLPFRPTDMYLTLNPFTCFSLIQNDLLPPHLSSCLMSYLLQILSNIHLLCDASWATLQIFTASSWIFHTLFSSFFVFNLCTLSNILCTELILFTVSLTEILAHDSRIFVLFLYYYKPSTLNSAWHITYSKYRIFLV
jgi:hypothetical protein